MDFDELLSLEEQFYQDGYEQGKQDIIQETLTSGKMLGIQTGYQRLLLIGMIIGHLEVISQLGPDAYKSYKGRLRLEDIDVDSLLNNDDASIEKLDKLIKKLRNWIQMNSTASGRNGKVLLVPKMNIVDELILKVTGQMPNSSAAQNNNLEDW